MEPTDEPRDDTRYGWSDWEADDFRGRPPWRRGFQPHLFAVALVLFLGLLAVILLAAAGRF
jgi:hypothetical protein